MFGKLGDMGNLFKQAQEMQKKIEDIQANFDNVFVEGTAGGGLVKVTMSLSKIIQSIEIDPSLIKAEEKEILEDLVMTACNDATKKAEEKSSQEMQQVTGGLNLPSGFKLPF